MIAKHLNEAQNCAGDLAVAVAKRADAAGRREDYAEARRLHQQARDLGDLAGRIALLTYEAVELMAR